MLFVKDEYKRVEKNVSCLGTCTHIRYNKPIITISVVVAAAATTRALLIIWKKKNYGDNLF